MYRKRLSNKYVNNRLISDQEYDKKCKEKFTFYLYTIQHLDFRNGF